MNNTDSHLSTGIPGLDEVLCGLLPGDNVVLQVGSIEDYTALLDPFLAAACKQRKKITYFRFARHAPLVGPDASINVVTSDPQAGFETFLNDIHQVIASAGRGAHYIFDSLSDLTALTEEAAKISGIPYVMDAYREQAMAIMNGS